MAIRGTTAGKARAHEEAALGASSRAAPLRLCADVCQETMTYALERGGEHARVETVRCLVDTAEACLLAANMVARESEHAHDLLRLCADVCGCTAELCAEFEDDAQMKACRQACEEAARFAQSA